MFSILERTNIAPCCKLIAVVFAYSIPFLAASQCLAQEQNEVIKLETESCKLSRPPASFGSIASVLSQKNDQLVRRATIKVQDTDVALYLPKAKSYSVENTDSDDTKFGNTSTYISIDQNKDGVLQDHESFPTNLPIRILDSMFRVTEIAADGGSISLSKIGGPLFGAVLNRQCPEFSHQTVDGKTISNRSILGKITILDIWAVT